MQVLKKDLITGKVRFSDVKQFPRSNYHVSMEWQYLGKWIKEHQSNLGLELNPEFQRGHVWTLKQQKRFIEFCMMSGTSALNVYFNHPGWMSDWDKHKGYRDFVCVDGLQRITAVLAFLDNKVPVFGGNYNSDFDRIGRSVCVLNVNIASLQSEEEVLEWYLSINAGGTVHSEKDLTKVRMMLANLRGDI